MILDFRFMKPGRRKFVARTAAAVLAVGLSSRSVLRAAANDNWGDLAGRFVYDGKPPERKKLKVDKDLWFTSKFDIRDESLLVGEGGGLANVFVFLRTRKVAIAPELEAAIGRRVTLDNRDCIFKPHCLWIWCAKQEFYIVNSDPVARNVAFSPLGDSPANIVLAVGKDATCKFSRPQIAPVPIACNYHPWESGYILPRDNPYVAISSADGTFRIKGLPPGTLEFQVWHERTGNLATPEWTKGRFSLDIKPGMNQLGTIKLEPGRFDKK